MVYGRKDAVSRARRHADVKRLVQEHDGDLRKVAAALRIRYGSLSALLNRPALHDWWTDFKAKRAVRRARESDKRKRVARMQRMYPDFVPPEEGD
jgi:hypothetical protein